MRTRIVLMFIGICAATTADCQSSVRHSQVVECSQATLARPDLGSAYKGDFVNDDYAFSVRIPNDLTGWSGVAESAPFHGFTIFLNPQESACIEFEVHIRVDEEDAPKFSSGGKTIRLGNVKGQQSFHEGRIGDVSMINIRAIFSVHHANRWDDGEVLFIIPTENFKKTKIVYDDFIKSMKFK
jgi:hypothetical protein